MSLFQNHRTIPGLADRWDGVDGLGEIHSTAAERATVLRHNAAVHAAQARLFEEERGMRVSAEFASAESLASLASACPVAQIDRTYKTTPPATIGLPRQIAHTALAARLLPAPFAAAALAHQAAGTIKA